MADDGAEGQQGMHGTIVCEIRSRCSFYRELEGKVGLAFFFLSKYCHGPGFLRCARYRLMSRGQEVPEGLFPSGVQGGGDAKKPNRNQGA